MNFATPVSPLCATRRIALALSLFGVAASAAADSLYEQSVDALRAQDYPKAYRNLETLASEDGRAQFQLALMYHAGLHVEYDEGKAVMLYHMAARNGVIEAQEFLVAAYQHGWFGLPRNEQVALFWQRQAAAG
jgi:TPR repeat protein